MTKEEAQQFVRKSISHAMARDGSSGGVIRLVVIDKTGVSILRARESTNLSWLVFGCVSNFIFEVLHNLCKSFPRFCTEFDKSQLYPLGFMR